MQASPGSQSLANRTTSTTGTQWHLRKVDKVKHSMPQVVSEYSTLASIAERRPSSHGGSINVQSAAERSSRRSTRRMPSQELKLESVGIRTQSHPGGTIIQLPMRFAPGFTKSSANPRSRKLFVTNGR